MHAAVQSVVLFIGASAGTLLLGLITRWVDRKVTARVQWRVGPPWYQPFVDVLKLLGKETILPEHAGWGFLLAPVVAFAATCLAAAVIVAANVWPERGFVGDLIVVMYLLVVPSLMIVLGGSLSGNPFGSVGAAREMKLMLAYELPLVLAVLAVVFGVTGGRTLRMGALAHASMNGPLPTLACVAGFLITVLCIQAKMGLVPFDIAEAETEIMGGPFVEYSGAPLAMFYLTRAMLFAVLPMFAVTIFWGGFGPDLAGWLLGFAKYLVIVVIMVLIRNTNPRVRIDHALKFFWFGLTPVGLVILTLSVVANAP